MMPPEDLEAMDPGLAGERTELAWTRTAIAFAAVGGAILKTIPVAGIPIVAMGALIYVLGRISRPERRGARHKRRLPLLLVTIAVTTMAGVALAIAFLNARSPLPPQ